MHRLHRTERRHPVSTALAGACLLVLLPGLCSAALAATLPAGAAGHGTAGAHDAAAVAGRDPLVRPAAEPVLVAASVASHHGAACMDHDCCSLLARKAAREETASPSPTAATSGGALATADTLSTDAWMLVGATPARAAAAGDAGLWAPLLC